MNYKQLSQATDSIKKVAILKMDIDTSLKFGKMMKSLNDDLSIYQEERLKIIKRFAGQDETIVPVDHPSFNEAVAETEKLSETEISTKEIISIPIALFRNTEITFTPDEAVLLEEIGILDTKEKSEKE